MTIIIVCLADGETELPPQPATQQNLLPTQLFKEAVKSDERTDVEVLWWCGVLAKSHEFVNKTVATI